MAILRIQLMLIPVLHLVPYKVALVYLAQQRMVFQQLKAQVPFDPIVLIEWTIAHRCTGADPSAATITLQNGSTLTVTTGAETLNIDVTVRLMQRMVVLV